MAGWLAKATKSFSRKAPDVSPQPFVIACNCRNDVTGIREERHQVVRCARCGTSLFVLPRNPYPQPDPPSAPSDKGKPPSSRPTSRTKPTKTKTRKDQRSEEPAPVETAPRSSMGQRFRESAQNARGRAKGIVVSAARRQREVFTPFRLVLMAMAAVAVGTGYWVWHHNALENANIDFKKYADSGEQAFADSSFSVAAADLAKATAALDRLGRDDPRALEIRQMSREATAASNLLRTSLLDVVDDAQKTQEQGDGGWDDRFPKLYGQSWIVIFSRVEQSVDAAGVTQLMFDYPLPVDGKSIVLSVRSDQAPQLGSVDQPRQAIVGARLASCRRGGLAYDKWIVTLDPESAFLWTNFEPLVSLGMADKQAAADDPVRAVLSEQRRLLEGER